MTTSTATLSKDDGAVAVKVDGLRVRGAAEAHGEYLAALRRGRKEPFMAWIFERVVPSGATVVDGGAYIGFYTLLAARAVGPSGRVLSFEPNQKTFGALRRNVRENGFEDRVELKPVGLGSRSGWRSFYLDEGDASKSSLFVPQRWHRATTTACTSLDSELGGGAVGVAKLDLEGGEVEALRGMRRVIRSSPGLLLFVECNPPALARAGTSVEALLGELLAAGLSVRVIDEARQALAPPGPELARMRGHVNLFCERSALA